LGSMEKKILSYLKLLKILHSSENPSMWMVQHRVKLTLSRYFIYLFCVNSTGVNLFLIF
jgi:hypothetical protein